MIDRIPPSAAEAEQALVGSILLDSRLLDDCDLLPSEFFDEGAKRTYQALQEMQAAGEAIDPVTLKTSLGRDNAFDAMGGATALKRMGELGTTARSVFRQHAKAIREAATKRGVIMAGAEITAAGYNSESAAEAVEVAERAVYELAETRSDQEPRTAAEVVTASVDAYDARERGEGAGLSTGLAELDDKCGLMRNGELLILAGRTSMGKTALAVNIAQHAAVELALPVLYVSLEMSGEEITDRMLSAMAKVDGKKIRDGLLSRNERKRFVEQASVIANAPLLIDDAPIRTMTAIASIARKQKRQRGLALLVIDYLQLITTELRKEPRNVQIGDITRRLKGLAREVQVPVLCLAQLNRETESNKGQRPKLSNLRESGSIEQDANQVWFCHRPGYVDKTQPAHEADITVAKNRSGPTGVAKVHWNAKNAQFVDAAPSRLEAEEPNREQSFDDWNNGK